jgi:hypothetical protein
MWAKLNCRCWAKLECQNHKSASFVQIDSTNRARYLIVVTYGDYQQVNGTLVPLNLTETMNGQIQWALQLNTPSVPAASVNSSYFHF